MNSRLDRWHIGHLIFGLIIGIIPNLLGLLLPVIIWFCVSYSVFLWYIFPVWELIEHTIIASYHFPKGWDEPTSNLVLDIILGIIAYEMAVRLLFFLIFSQDIPFSVISNIFAFQFFITVLM